MERVQIKKRNDAKNNKVHTGNYDVYIDGEKQSMAGVTSISIELDANCTPEVTIKGNPKHLELDIDGVQSNFIDSSLGDD